MTGPALAAGPRIARLAGLALAVGAFAACLVGLKDPDAFHLMAAGREMVRLRGLPETEPFLYPLAGLPASWPSWLFSVALYLSHQAAGLAGPVLLAAALAAATFAVLFVDAAAERPSPLGILAATVPLALALAVLRPRAAPRPEMLAYLMVALTSLGIRRIDEGRRGIILAFPFLVLLWTNAHQSALTGLAMVVIALAFELLRQIRAAPPERRWSAARMLGAAVCAGAVAALVNPGGLAPLTTAVRFALSPLTSAPPSGQAGALEMVSRSVGEMAPTTLRDMAGPLGALVALTALSSGLAPRPTTARDLVISGAALALALTARRHHALAAILLAPVAGRHMARVAERMESKAPLRWLTAGALAAGLAAAGWVVAWAPGASFGTSLVPQAYPLRATAYLSALGFRGRLFNRFETGGYLEWALVRPVFQDGRGSVRPEDVAAAFSDAAHQRDFEALDHRYRFDALLVGRPEWTEAMAAISSRLGPDRDLAADRARWALVAFDDGGLLYLRRDGNHATDAARDEYRYAIPGNPLLPERYAAPALRPGLVADLTRASVETPWCRSCRVQLGWALWHAGRFTEVEEVLAPALGGPSETEVLALQILAAAAAGRGDRALARRRHRQVLGLGASDPAVTRRELARLDLADGDLDGALRLVRRNLAEDPANPDDRRLLLELEARQRQ